MIRSAAIGFGVSAVLSTLPASAQPAADRQGSQARSVEERQQRYQIGTMERVLEGAVEHGAEVTRERLRAYIPADMLLSENALARGFRLEGYGMFFDVAVPSLEGTLPWMIRSLDQNNLGLESALRTLRSFIEASSADDADVQQALRRVELMAPTTAGVVSDPRDVVGTAAINGPVAGPVPAGSTRQSVTNARPVAPEKTDSILERPQEAYRAEVRDALMDAMLDHSRGLGLGPNEWLTIAARSNEVRPRLAPPDTDTGTVVIKVRGADLNAFLGGQISRDEARKRMDVRVF